jgi:hypothetical protein
MELRPLPKLIGTVRRERKDIFLVGLKHRSGAPRTGSTSAGLHLVKEAFCNLVRANDTGSRLNMVVTPEEARDHVTTDRDEALRGLVAMAYLRSHLTFTRSTVVAGVEGDRPALLHGKGLGLAVRSAEFSEPPFRAAPCRSPGTPS